jgi:quercetin dioxygenase-like cupin family protein
MRTSKPAARTGAVETRTGRMFTGTAWGEVLMPNEANAGLNRVTFSPGSRTVWHRHEGGQMLIGEAGSGLVVTRSGEVTHIGDGVIVHACPREEHWHGAMPDSFMTHISCVLSGETQWLEEVSEDDYRHAVEKARQDAALR